MLETPELPAVTPRHRTPAFVRCCLALAHASSRTQPAAKAGPQRQTQSAARGLARAHAAARGAADAEAFEARLVDELARGDAGGGQGTVDRGQWTVSSGLSTGPWPLSPAPARLFAKRMASCAKTVAQ